MGNKKRDIVFIITIIALLFVSFTMLVASGISYAKYKKMVKEPGQCKKSCIARSDYENGAYLFNIFMGVIGFVTGVILLAIKWGHGFGIETETKINIDALLNESNNSEQFFQGSQGRGFQGSQSRGRGF
jgi:hypothetical protein